MPHTDIGGRTLVSEFRSGTTAARSLSSASVNEVYRGTHDLLICVSGWDARATSIIEAQNLRADAAWLITFREKDESGYRERNDESLRGFLRNIADTVIEISPSAGEIEKAWEDLRVRLLQLYFQKNRALRIAIDSSACPRYISLALLALALDGAIARELHIYYAEGWYPERPEVAEIAFTLGPWRTIHVPGMEGTYSPGSSRFYLIALGFEGHKTLRVVNTADPDRISVLLPDPGTHPQYTARTLEDNRDLLDVYNVPEGQIVRAAAGDAVGAWLALANAGVERFDQENVHYLCSGTKAHSLALGLRALTTAHRAAVLYNVPERYSPVIVEPAGKYWSYSITNLGAPPI